MYSSWYEHTRSSSAPSLSLSLSLCLSSLVSLSLLSLSSQSPSHIQTHTCSALFYLPYLSSASLDAPSNHNLSWALEELFNELEVDLCIWGQGLSLSLSSILFSVPVLYAPSFRDRRETQERERERGGEREREREREKREATRRRYGQVETQNGRRRNIFRHS